MSSSKKLKILLTGPVNGKMDLFVNKLESLQQSKAGPFDACFCVGPFGSSVQEMPLPVYIQEFSGVVETKESTEEDSPEGVVKLATNLQLLQGTNGAADVYALPIRNQQLIVASCPPHVRLDTSETKPIQDKIGHVSYCGCDLFLSSEWPQGVESVLAPSSAETSETTTAPIGSFDIAELALRARPRYHVAPTNGTYQQSMPFWHLESASSTRKPQHVGRFIVLAPVVSPEELKAKGKTAGKFVHALGLTPLHDMGLDELSKTPLNVQPCPYTDASYQKDDHLDRNDERTTKNNIGLSEAQARRIMAEGSAAGDHRWKSGKRQRPPDESEIDPSSKTLFVHGLHKDVSGRLQTGGPALLQAFAEHGVVKVRRPPSASSYAFLEFASHEDAKACLEELGGETVVAGIHLTLKWASGGPTTKHPRAAGAPPPPPGGVIQPPPPPKKRRLTEAEAQHSSTLYFRFPPKILSSEHEAASEDLRLVVEHSLEVALAQDGSGEDEERVTAETEPALQVKARMVGEDKNYGFLEFASHVAASMALATLTGSTDGGSVQEEAEKMLQGKDHLRGVALHWANESAQKPGMPSGAKDGENGLTFQRRHFPPDGRTDCWFCLASPGCERHLIASVHDNCYIAVPKGPVGKGHVLLVPVAHSSKGALVDPTVANEMDILKQKLRKHASEVWDMDLFVFERAIQTKGGYHTHVQCIPVERGVGTKIQSTMMAMARSIPGFDLREINSDLALSAMIAQGGDDEESTGGYFYAEIPLSGMECKRFLFRVKAPTGGNKMAVVPLQFGREVLASVLDKPDLAHWKACVVDMEKETEMTLSFRNSFAKYDHNDF